MLRLLPRVQQLFHLCQMLVGNMLAAAGSSSAVAHPGFSLQQLLPPQLVVGLGSMAGR